LNEACHRRSVDNVVIEADSNPQVFTHFDTMIDHSRFFYDAVQCGTGEIGIVLEKVFMPTRMLNGSGGVSYGLLTRKLLCPG
jgi:hypothetical protein